MRLRCHHRKDNVVTVLLEFQDKLNTRELVSHAEIDCSGGTDEIHGLRAVPDPGINIFEVKPGFFLLKEYPHALRIHCIHCALLQPSRRIARPAHDWETGRLTGTRLEQSAVNAVDTQRMR